MSPLGTLRWARSTGGRLRLRDRFLLLRDALKARLAARRSGHGSTAELAETARRPLPSGPLLAIAERACRADSPLWLVDHCLRTFIWGELLAARDGVALDRDALFLAAVLHDLGLTPAHAPPEGECFAFAGAEAASRLLHEARAPADLAAAVSEAIVLHVNPWIDRKHGPVAVYLQAGAALDVVGARARAVPRERRQEVLAVHPRAGFKREIEAALAEAARRAPDSRIGWLCARFGFLGMIRHAPFAE